uniref:Tegument protein UL16 n=1 Tax=Wood mouse herpesvirus TaxID=432370 RepID=D0PPC2_9GAMA|nr:tegument protein UL16 [Wood mouse herpesvirus]
MATREDIIQTFLNKECIWIVNKASCCRKKVFTSTTALSPRLRHHFGVPGDGAWCINVTVLILKPKQSPFSVTVFINGKPILCSDSKLISIQRISGKERMAVIYFGKFTGKSPIPVPMDPTILEPGTGSAQILCPEVMDSSTLAELPVSGASKQVGYTAWLANNSIYEYMLSTEHQMMCPSLPVFPSLSKILNIMTSCTSPTCKKCTGYRRHCNVCSGYTALDEDGYSPSCPCTTSCAIKPGDPVPITGHRTLLPLLFDPVNAHRVKSLSITPASSPQPLDQIITGLTEAGDRLPITLVAWKLVRLSDFHSHVYVTSCKKLKSHSHSC